MMTRNDHYALAEEMNRAKPDDPYRSERLVMWEGCVAAVVRVCAAGNPRFKKDLFWDICAGRR